MKKIIWAALWMTAVAASAQDGPTMGFISGDNHLICVGVNGKTVETVEAKGSGWSQISEKTLKIRLNKGNNTIRLSNATAWLPDIDYIDLTKR